MKRKAEKFYETYFIVEGRGSFPFDMLRYDQCFPTHEGEARQMEYPLGDPLEKRQVMLTQRASVPRITYGRWMSFNWRVIKEGVDRYALQDVWDLNGNGSRRPHDMIRNVATIMPSDVGCYRLIREVPRCEHCRRGPEKKIIMTAIGPIQENDVGKMVFDNDGVIQVENDAQRNQRLGRTWKVE